MTRSNPALYDEDFFAWTQDQAAAIRAMSPRSNEGAIDVEHLSEEIEDLGRRDLREVASYLARVLEHLVKLHVARQALDAEHWFSEIVRFQISALAAYSPSMRQRLDIDDIWSQARQLSKRFLDRNASLVLPTTPPPLTLDFLLSRDFDADSALATFSAALEREA